MLKEKVFSALRTGERTFDDAEVKGDNTINGELKRIIFGGEFTGVLKGPKHVSTIRIQGGGFFLIGMERQEGRERGGRVTI